MPCLRGRDQGWAGSQLSRYQCLSNDWSGPRERRIMSSSKVEGIVTAELRVRRQQSDRAIHRPTDSLLSWTKQGLVDTKGLVNWAVMLLCLCGARLALENLLTHGLRRKGLLLIFSCTF